ncbi:MAG TPA: SPOR domain-containing protein [Casimicrobiaceae bacterium]|jgi:cell division protein FtsN
MAQSQSRAAQPGRNRAPRQRAAGGTLLGIFIGLVMGLVLAAGVAYYLMGGRSVYQSQVNSQKNVREPAADAAKLAANDKASDKPRFDFYKILPGGEEPKIQPGADKAAPPRPDRAMAEKAHDKSASDKAAGKPAPAPVVTAALPDSSVNADVAKGTMGKERFWLQAGSFTDEADAENLKAQLALAGWQAAVQRGTLADKSVRFRVRLGPYDNSDELARVKRQLAQRGYDVAAIKY